MYFSPPSSFLSRLRRQWFNWLCLLAMAALGLLGLLYFRDPEKLRRAGLLAIAGVGLLGVWRWSWFGLHVLRSRIYLYWTFPRWRRRANRMPNEEIPSVGIVVPTFREKPWITDRVFRAIAYEAQTLSQPMTVVAVTTPEEIVAIEEIFRSVDPNLRTIRYVPILDPAAGKRKALSVGLRAMAALDNPPEIVCLMDGDSVIEAGAMRKCLPFFRMMPRLGGLTTNERAVVDGSKFFEEWLHLRFAQRHLYMASHALSHRILCLTGRYSLYRSEAALDPSFAQLLESDMLNDWLWGEFKFLSGDDKSTWYWVLKHGYELIYVPDVMVETIETISGNIPLRMYQNMRRWFGNMLRNGSRAMALGPERVGWFAWYCLLDQRISFWTSLIAPGLLLIYTLRGNWVGVGLIGSWLLFSRSLSLFIFAWGRDVDIKPIHVFQNLLSQWGSSLIKIYTQMNLAQQKWSNRGNQSRSAAGTGFGKFVKLGTSRFLLVAQGCSFAIVLLCMTGLMAPQADVQGLWWRKDVDAIEQPVQILAASQYGVTPDDGKDDSAALQRLLYRLPAEGLIQIDLPAGELELARSLKIERSHTILRGQGASRTVLRSGTTANPLIVLNPSKSAPWLDRVRLSQFTLIQTSEAPAISLQNARQSELKNLQFQGEGSYAVVLQNAPDLQVEYVAFDGKFSQPPIVHLNQLANREESRSVDN